MNNSSNKRNAVFGIVVGGQLLYDTLKSNPEKSVRYFRRLKTVPEGEPELTEFTMRRVPKKDDIRSIVNRALKNEPYVGPMR